MLYDCPVNLTAIHLVDFEISREKGDFLKTTVGHLGPNSGSNLCVYFLHYMRYRWETGFYNGG